MRKIGGVYVTLYHEVPIILKPGQISGIQTVEIPFSARYVAVENPTNATITFAVGNQSSPIVNGTTINPFKSYSGQMQQTQTVTVSWSSTSPLSGTNLVTFRFSDEPIPLSMSDNGNTVQVVNQPGGQLNVGGTVNIGNTPQVTIEGTPSVNISNASIPVTGDVNATITNASIPVTGSVSIEGNPSVNIANTPSVNIASGTVDVTGSSVQVTNTQFNTIVANPQTQPVPTIPQTYYGTGAEGAFSPSSNYQFNNTPNQADIHNFTSVNIPADVTVSWSNPAHYAVWFVQGNVNIAGTINVPFATPNVSPSQPAIKLFNGAIQLIAGGNGGAGGAGGTSGVGGITGGAGGTASPYGSGAGGGGGGGSAGNNGGSAGSAGNNGQTTSVSGGSGGNGYSGGNAGQSGQSVVMSFGTATFIIIASGTITISGTINAKGTNGGNGGNGGNANSGGGGGGGGGAGAGSGGVGGNGATATSNNGYGGGGGGGGGGSGGGVVLLYSGANVSITGSINVNGGTGGLGGAGGTGYGAGAGQNGQNGQAGTVLVYQYNNQASG
jgi:hypothetical protein